MARALNPALWYYPDRWLLCFQCHWILETPHTFPMWSLWWNLNYRFLNLTVLSHDLVPERPEAFLLLG
ncbi:uncharacterized protein J3R85_002886 [Psidium guajava]|nr:uncharacterized protein J3R85_002886 [Psidium guajava]